MATDNSTERRMSAGVYTRFVLFALYERGVLGLNFSFAWGCPVDRELVPLFADNLSERHLDCGVGTGYFPAQALESRRRQDRPQSSQLTLLDLNDNCLMAARDAIRAVSPQTQVKCVIADIRAPVPQSLEGSAFDSISMFNLFHCIPGGFRKFDAIGTYKRLLTDQGVLVGCTVLGEKHASGWFAPQYLRLYNRVGVFSNLADTEEEIVDLLRSEFIEVQTWLVGMVLLFRAVGPKREERLKK